MTQNSTNKWKDKPCSWFEMINTVKMPISTKSIYIFKDLYQDTNSIFHRSVTKNSKIIMKPPKNPKIQQISERRKMLCNQMLCKCLQMFQRMLKLPHNWTHLTR